MAGTKRKESEGNKGGSPPPKVARLTPAKKVAIAAARRKEADAWKGSDWGKPEDTYGSSFEYDGHGGWNTTMHVRVPEVNPWNLTNSLSQEERHKASLDLFEGAAAELDVVIPQALKDREEREVAKGMVQVSDGIT